jgi:glutathione peroxidase
VTTVALGPRRNRLGQTVSSRQREESRLSLYDIPLRTLHGEPASLAPYKGKALLLVNVASRCGLTPQYSGLEELHAQYAPRGFSVLGFPCNQFGGQEPGTPAEIETFCSTNYGVTFPLFEKLEVNGPGRHPLYEQLTRVPDDEGKAGDIQWNFEKFLVSPGGDVVARFRPLLEPKAPELVASIEKVLPA